MKSNYELKTEARMALRDNWIQPVLTQLVQELICGGLLIEIFLVNPIAVGAKNAYRRLLHKDPEVFSNTFNISFGGDYTHKVCTMLLRDVYLILWSLLLFIPGLVKSYSYALVPYLIEDEPELDADSCIHRSRCLMAGHKWDLFCLDMSFIGWFFLCLLTLGIGFLWLMPYVKTAHALFYEDLTGYTAPVEEQ